MTQRRRHSGAVTCRRAFALALLLTAPLVFAGCHDEDRLRARLEGPPTRLPVEPNQVDTPPVPALLDTVQPWSPEPAFPARAITTWSIVTIRIDRTFDLTYRVPDTWTTDDTTGKAFNLGKLVTAQARITDLTDSAISLAAYAAQLAEGNPLYQYTTQDGHVIYVTRREVALAPSDPEAPRQVFHTAVVSVDGHIVKLDVRYATEVDWRFDELADAISGTMQVRRREED